MEDSSEEYASSDSENELDPVPWFCKLVNDGTDNDDIVQNIVDRYFDDYSALEELLLLLKDEEHKIFSNSSDLNPTVIANNIAVEIHAQKAHDLWELAPHFMDLCDIEVLTQSADGDAPIFIEMLQNCTLLCETHLEKAWEWLDFQYDFLYWLEKDYEGAEVYKEEIVNYLEKQLKKDSTFMDDWEAGSFKLLTEICQHTCQTLKFSVSNKALKCWDYAFGHEREIAQHYIVLDRLFPAKTMQLSNYGFFDEVSICSYNIKFLGALHKNDAEYFKELHQCLQQYDMTIVQELVSHAGIYTEFTTPNQNSDDVRTRFFSTMNSSGYQLIRTPIKTGRKSVLKKETTAAEHHLAFINQKFQFVDNQTGYIADPVSDCVFDRVPAIFTVKVINSNSFNGPQPHLFIMNVHLSTTDTRRQLELQKICDYLQNELLPAAPTIIEHLIIVGDFNFKNQREQQQFSQHLTEAGLQRAATSPKGYDNIYVSTKLLQIYDIQKMNVNNELLSDHSPIAIKLKRKSNGNNHLNSNSIQSADRLAAKRHDKGVHIISNQLATLQIKPTMGTRDTKIHQVPSLNNNNIQAPHVPHNNQNVNGARSGTLAEFKKEGRDFLKGKMIKILGGVHAGSFGTFGGWNGSNVKIIINGEVKYIAIAQRVEVS